MARLGNVSFESPIFIFVFHFLLAIFEDFQIIFVWWFYICLWIVDDGSEEEETIC